MGWFKLFLSLHVAPSLPPSFYSRGYMVWKMLVEEFQDDCLVLGNLWYANGMILAISKSPCCTKPSIKFLLKRIYGLEEDVGWRIPRWLFSARQSLICKWDDNSYFWGSCCLKPSIKFLLKRIYGLEEDIGWRIPRWLFSARQSLICKWDELNYFWVSMLPEPFHWVSTQGYMVWKMLVEEFQDGCLVLDKLW